jgi:GT2 family glycosyltransferase
MISGSNELEESWKRMMKSEGYPSVAVVITARNRPGELRRTLQELKQQLYLNFSVVVIDDASEPSLESVVRDQWPDSFFIRNEVSRGACANRNAAMQLASADFIVFLDDDSCFTDPEDLNSAVARMQSAPAIGMLSFAVYASDSPVPPSLPARAERYISRFIACGCMLRSEVFAQIGGFREIYSYFGEESEYGMRIWDSGWRILFFPMVLIHHRLSYVNRSLGNTIRHSVRNTLWTTILNIPWPRVALQITWRLISTTLEAVRLMELSAWWWGLSSCVAGLPIVLRMRKPIKYSTLKLLDTIETKVVTPTEDLHEIQPVGWLEFLRAFSRKWMHRSRARNFWDRRAGNLGRDDIVLYKHSLLSSSEQNSSPRGD